MTVATGVGPGGGGGRGDVISMPTPVQKNDLHEMNFLVSLFEHISKRDTNRDTSGPAVGLCVGPLLGAVCVLLERTATGHTYFIVYKSPDTPQKYRFSSFFLGFHLFSSLLA